MTDDDLRFRSWIDEDWARAEMIQAAFDALAPALPPTCVDAFTPGAGRELARNLIESASPTNRKVRAKMMIKWNRVRRDDNIRQYLSTGGRFAIINAHPCSRYGWPWKLYDGLQFLGSYATLKYAKTVAENRLSKEQAHQQESEKTK
jgi:hypothetical protein